MVDFDAIVIKQQLAEAPMNIEVKRRKDFLDSKEGRARGQKKVEAEAVSTPTPVVTVEVPIDETPVVEAVSKK